MQLLVVALLVGLVSTATTDNKNEPLEVIVKGLPEGEPLEIGDILEVKLKERVNGQIVASSDALFPFTAEGLAEQPKPEDIVDPKPVLPESPVVPELPEPEIPEASPPVVVLSPEQDGAVLLPIIPDQPENPEQPDVVQPQPDIVEEAPVEAPNGELFNNGVVQVQVNAEDSGVLSTIQSWFSMVVNYFNGSETTSEQIV